MAAAPGPAAMREANEYTVLRLISLHAPVTKSEIVDLTGLSRPTVLSIVATLESEQLIRSEKAQVGAVGRAPLLYSPNPQFGHVVGVDLGGSKVLAAVADMAGTVLAEREEPTDRRGGLHVVEQVVSLARAVVEEAGLPWGSVRAVTVGSPGVLAADGTIELAGNIRNFDRIDVPGELGSRLGLEVTVENDVNLAAVGEHAFGHGQGCRSLALLAIGSGVGLGIISNGELLRGARGRAGEIAYLPLGGDPARPEARERGALELAVSGSGFRELSSGIRQRRSGRSSHAGPREEDPEAVVADAALGDPTAVEIVGRYATLVAQTILAAAAILDPELVVLGGGIGSNAFLLGPVRAEVQRIAPFPVQVEVSRFGQRAGLIGAIADARRSALSRLIAVPEKLWVSDVDSVFAGWSRMSTAGP